MPRACLEDGVVDGMPRAPLGAVRRQRQARWAPSGAGGPEASDDKCPPGAAEAQVGHVIPLVGRQRVVPHGRRAEHICLPWQVSLLLVLKGVQGLPALLKVVEGVKGVTPLSPPSPPPPLAPGSPYDARPGIQRFRGTPTRAPGLVRRGVGCAGPVRVDSAHQNDDRVQPRAVRAETVETTPTLSLSLAGARGDDSGGRERESERLHSRVAEPPCAAPRAPGVPNGLPPNSLGIAP